MTTGRYSDGRFLEGHSVEVEFADGHLNVVGEGVARRVPTAELRWSDPLASIPQFVYFPDGAVLELNDAHDLRSRVPGAEASRLARSLSWLERQSHIAAIATLALVALVASGLYFGVPRLAANLAVRAPESVEKQAGAIAMEALDQYLGPSQIARRHHLRAEKQLQRLLPSRQEAELPILEICSMGDLANAFALPGDRIVVSDKLLLLLSDDELAAVLAHELGHLENRHGLQSVVRSSLALLFVATVTGDLSSLTTFAGSLPFLILTNGYSRDLEREADRYARQLLEARAIDVRAFSNALAKLEKAAASETTASYLSTHPSVEERIQLFGDPVPAAESDAETVAAPPVVGDRGPQVIHRVEPTYPPEAAQAGLQGVVMVEFYVGEDGEVYQPRAIHTDHRQLNAAAVEAITQWRFEPAYKNGHPTQVRHRVSLHFRLDETN